MENGTKDSEKLISEILEGAKESMKLNLQEQIKKNISEHLTWSLREHLSKITADFVKDEMTEDIKQLLIEQKPIILESLKDSFIKIGAQVAQSMCEQASKNLAVNTYQMRDILKKIVE